jgi:uncharacterized protein YydD (DUF2326 family)
VSVALNTFEDLLFKQMKEERLGNLPSELNSLKDDLVVAEHHLKTDLNVFNKPKKEYITKIASIKEDIAKKTNEISKIEKTFDSLKSTPDFKDKVTTKKEELIKTETTKVANKEKERVTNKPIPVRDYAANEVKRKKQSNSKSAGGWSHSLEPTEIEELEKDKENERG